MTPKNVLAGLALALAAFASPAYAKPVMKNVRINFAGMVGKAPFRCGQTYAGIGNPAAKITPTDFRFYVTDVALIAADGHRVPLALEQDGRWQYRNVALVDFEDGSGPCLGGNAGTNTTVTGIVPTGHYRGLSFHVGLPFALDHGDPSLAPAPLNYTGMFWVWQVGYRFLKVDLAGEVARMAGKPAGFSVHIGSTGCDSPSMTDAPTKPCAAPNAIEVTFDRFDPKHDVVVADLAALLAGTNTGHNQPDTAPGCMSSPDDSDCKAIFGALGLPFPGVPAGKQSVFRVR